MNTAQPIKQGRPSPEVCADAAVWLARMRGPNRTAEVEEGFRQWLGARPEHATAFEMATDAWDKSARLRRRTAENVVSLARPQSRAGYFAAAAALTACAVLAGMLYFRDDAVITAIGEQRSITLEDGSRVFMNTDTRAAVRYSEAERRILLDKGEALFEVAPRPGRPFVVIAGDSRITALGTTFVVRRDMGRLAITLVEGKVTVAPAEQVAGEVEGRVLNPGERLTLSGAGPGTVDLPVIDKMIAWQRGQVVFDSTALADAVDEMNRYSSVKLAIEHADARALRVSGVFRAGDAASFADAMAETYRIRIVREDRRIVLSGVPDVPASSRAPGAPSIRP